jgi:hypothetical protein
MMGQGDSSVASKVSISVLEWRSKKKDSVSVTDGQNESER